MNCLEYGIYTAVYHAVSLRVTVTCVIIYERLRTEPAPAPTLHVIKTTLRIVDLVIWFLANVNSRSRPLYAIARPSVVCLSSVTFVRFKFSAIFLRH